MAKLYSNEQVNRAKSVNLVDFLRRYGEETKPVGSEYVWIYHDSQGKHDSVTINPYKGKWFDHKNQIGGDTIGFLQEFMNYSFSDAVAVLLDGEMGSEETVNKTFTKTKYDIPQKEKSEFILPEKSQNMRNTFAYLIKTRFIDKDIVQHFIDQKAIYQENIYKNVVFVGFDENGNPVSACKKSTNSYSSYNGTVEGSNTDYGFSYKGENNKLFVFEAPIDMLSFMTIYKKNYEDNNYVALDGLSPKVMLKFLELNPNIDEIYICTDHDAAGIESYDKFKDILIDKGYSKVLRILPEQKDWNEILKSRNGITPKAAESHPKINAYKKMCLNLYNIFNKSKGCFENIEQSQSNKEIMDCLKSEYNNFNSNIKNVSESNTEIAEIQKSLYYLLGASLHSLIKIKTAVENDFDEEKYIEKKSLELIDSYKPYIDKGKFRSKYNRIDESYKELKNSLLKEENPSSASEAFFNFIDNAIRFKIYMDIDFQHDIQVQNKFRQNAEKSSKSPIVKEFTEYEQNNDELEYNQCL